jgi:hypothetical protein
MRDASYPLPGGEVRAGAIEFLFFLSAAVLTRRNNSRSAVSVSTPVAITRNKECFLFLSSLSIFEIVL